MQVRVPADRFAQMTWPFDAIGAQAIIYPGHQAKEHTRTAIQVLSRPAQRRVFAHLGWRKLGEHWVYLHAGGALSAAGPASDVTVTVPNALQGFILPASPTGQALIDAVHASLRFLTVAPKQVTIPLYAALWRSVLGDTDFSLHLAGKTGEGKTALAALIQQHFGAGMDAEHLPAGWNSTSNALEGFAFLAKDVLMVVDDFCPAGTGTDVERYHQAAERLFRAQGNKTGRQRMNSDSSLQAAKPPRGLLLSTGEDIPKGHSLRARLFVVEIAKGATDWDAMTLCQQDARTGVYAQVMSAYLCWLAGRHEELRGTLKDQVERQRQKSTKIAGAYKRTASIVADLEIGLKHFFRFTQEMGALTEFEAARLRRDAGRVLHEIAQQQVTRQLEADPTRCFLTLLRSAILSGRAYISDAATGDAPPDSSAWGWGEDPLNNSLSKPRGMCVGWIAGDDLYLDATAAFAAVQQLGRDIGQPLTITSQTLTKRLAEAGHLLSQEPKRGTLTVRKKIGGRRVPGLLHISASTVLDREGEEESEDLAQAA